MPSYGTEDERQATADRALREISRASRRTEVIATCSRMIYMHQQGQDRKIHTVFADISKMLEPGSLAHSLAVGARELDQVIAPDAYIKFTSQTRVYCDNPHSYHNDNYYHHRWTDACRQPWIQRRY